MGDWIAWIIPLIAFIVWLISNVAKGAEQQAPRAGGMGQAPPRPRPASAEIDKFLEEINRRRQQQQQQRQRPAMEDEPKPLPPPRPRPAPRVEERPAPPPPRPKPARPKPAMPRPRPIETARPAPLLMPEVAPAPAAPLFAEEGQPPPTAPRPTAVGAPGANVLPTEFHKLLGSKQGIRLAFLAQEVLGPPVSRRRGGRAGILRSPVPLPARPTPPARPA